MIGEESKAERACRMAAGVITAALFFDLILIVVTGGLSFFTPMTKPTQASFALREIVFALSFVARFHVLALRERRLSIGHIAIALAVLPSLFHLHFVGRRITGDAPYYYVYTRSMIRDADVDFTNEYEHYDLLKRGDFSMPTSTGHRRSIYSVGPGLLWTPFFVAADALGAALQSAGIEVNTSGYGPLNLNAAALGSFSFGVAALFIIHAFLRLHFGDRLAAGTVLLLWWASFLEWYMAEQPLTSHPASALLVSLFFLLRQRDVLKKSGGAFALGLVLGIGMSVRWQNGVYLLLPAVDFVAALYRRESLQGILKRGTLLSAGVILGAVPQLLAWKAIYGEYILPYPPHGADFVRLWRPFLLNTLFSSRHGLLSWTPVFWLCFIGLIPLTRRSPRRFAILWAPLLIMTYVNACSGDWWSGGAYSNRRFDSLFPVFALGLAAFLSAARAFVKKRPMVVAGALVVGTAVWNISFARAIQIGEANSQAISLSARALASTTVFSAAVGFPTTWPASWIFAARYNASPAAFDLAAGKYLFYRQNNLEGVAELGESGDEGLILEGWTSARQDGPIAYRSLEAGRAARLIVSLDLPEPLTFLMQTRSLAGGTLAVSINGVAAGSLSPPAGWGTAELSVPSSLWKRGPNVIMLRPDGAIDVDRVTFERAR